MLAYPDNIPSDDGHVWRVQGVGQGPRHRHHRSLLLPFQTKLQAKHLPWSDLVAHRRGIARRLRPLGDQPRSGSSYVLWRKISAIRVVGLDRANVPLYVRVLVSSDG